MRPPSLALAVTLVLVGGAASAQDAKHGQTVFATYCAMCHSAAAGRTLMGPSLHDVVGRKAGALAGFSYSPAMASSGLTWTAGSLDSYIDNPKVFVPKNRMNFQGLHKPQDRADLIAFLASQK
jgi:cytochrome c